MKIINTLIKYICGFCLAVMVTMVVINTVLRYAFSTSIVQTEELCRYLFLWMVYLAVITVWDEKGHICVTLITDRVHGSVAFVLKIVVAVLSLYALYMLCYGSWLYLEETTVVGAVTYIPYKVMIAPVLLGALGCALLTIRDLVRDFRKQPPAGGSGGGAAGSADERAAGSAADRGAGGAGDRAGSGTAGVRG